MALGGIQSFTFTEVAPLQRTPHPDNSDGHHSGKTRQRSRGLFRGKLVRQRHSISYSGVHAKCDQSDKCQTGCELLVLPASEFLIEFAIFFTMFSSEWTMS